MKFLPIIIVFSLVLSLAGSASPAFADDGQRETGLSDRLIIQFDSGTSWSEMIKVHQQVGGKVVKTIPQIDSQVVTVPEGQWFLKSWVYRLHSKVRHVELDYVAQVLDVPNDPYFNDSYQWGMFQTQAPQAWDITHGSPSIRIAILDSGVDSSHPDLGAKVVAKENFTSSGTAEPVNNSHGTHVAGIAAAISNNGIGVAGLGYDCSLMNVKVAGDNGYGYYSWIAQGIIWATDNGADVINLSLGGTAPSSTLEQAVNYAWNHGVVVVAAAGNTGSTSHLYPAYYDKCLAVAATSDNDQLTSWSSYGSWVDVAAPGSAYSTKPNSQYGNMAGTSMASPHVAGLAGLVFSVAADTNGNGRLNDEVKTTIEATCDDVGIDVAYGRINAYHAVGSSSAPPTGQISGTVTDADSGKAISTATAIAGTTSVSTNSEGNYTISDLPQGTYTTTTSASGYQDASQTVTVAAGETSTANFSLNPIPNQAPVLNHIGNKTVDEGNLLQFTISASDLDGDALTYSASSLPKAASFSPSTRTFTWTPDYEQAGIYHNIHFEVSDGSLADSKDITITVNDMPLFGQISGTVTDANSGKAISTATATAGTTSVSTNSEGNYTISDLPQGTYTTTTSASGYQDASQTVTVAAGETSTANFSLNPIPNKAPVLNPIGNKTIDEGNLLQFTISASDPDGDALTYSASSLPKAASFSPSTRTFTWTPDYEQAGIYHDVHFEVSDGSLTESKDITITVNDVPLFGQLSGTVTDTDSGKAISKATVIAGTTSVSTNSEGNYTISDLPQGTYTTTTSASGYQDASQTVTVAAGETSTANFSLNPIPNQAPVLNPIGNKTIDEGNLLQFTISASDPDGDALTYSATNLPKAASFSPSTRTFTWTPDYEQAGIYHNIHFEVSDGSLTESKDITITVNDVSLFFAFLDQESSHQPVIIPE